MKRTISKPRPGVIVYRPVDATRASHRQLEAAGCAVHEVAEGEDLDAAIRRAQPVHALLAASLRGIRLDRARLEAMPDLRVVSKYTIGFDDVDLAAASERGIVVTHCPTEANTGGVAEGTIALMLAILKKLVARDRSVRAGHWRSPALNGTYLGARADGYPGITLGIVGLGRIGRRVAELLAPWKLRVVAADPYIEADVFSRYGASPLELDVLLREADVITIHCQLTDETAGLFDRSRIVRMKRGSILINTARGSIVDIDAVCDALDSGHLGGAAFDVLPEEPPAPGSRILRSDDRVILSPHMVAANAGGTLTAAVPWATEAVLDALAGRVPPRVCNEEAIEAWQRRFGGKSLLSG